MVRRKQVITDVLFTGGCEGKFDDAEVKREVRASCNAVSLEDASLAAFPKNLGGLFCV